MCGAGTASCVAQPGGHSAQSCRGSARLWPTLPGQLSWEPPGLKGSGPGLCHCSFSGHALHSLPSREANVEGDRTECPPAQGAARPISVSHASVGQKHYLHMAPFTDMLDPSHTSLCTRGQSWTEPPSVKSAHHKHCWALHCAVCSLEKQLTDRSALPTCFRELRAGFQSPRSANSLGFDWASHSPSLGLESSTVKQEEGTS